MSALTPEQDAAVRAIVAGMLKQALGGADTRVRGHLAAEPQPAAVRLECLRIAAQASGTTDPRPTAELLYRYVIMGCKTERHRQDLERSTPSAVGSSQTGSV